MSALTYRYVAMTDVGLRRTNNEDSGFAGTRLLAIADGMGGAAAGELASSTALNTLRRLEDGFDGDALDALEGAVTAANDRLAEAIADDPAVEGMGTTIEAMLWDGEKLAVAHLGDSRAYRLRGTTLTQISTDHTFVQSLVDEGRLTADEARQHPHRSLLLRALLGRDDNAPDLSWIQPQQGDRYLLCSDGLSDMVTDDKIEQALRAETIDLAATELVTLALEHGGVDNVTVVLAEFVAADAEPDPDLVCADGRPQLVGAAAEQPRPPTGHAVTPAAAPVDEEELRYASRPPGRRRRFKLVLGLVIVLAVIAGGGYAGYAWTQAQYYVSADGDQVAIYRGVDVDLPGISLSKVDERTTVQVASLPTYNQRLVRDGLPAENRADAQNIVAELTALSTPATNPTPTPSATGAPTAGTPSPKQSSTAAPDKD